MSSSCSTPEVSPIRNIKNIDVEYDRSEELEDGEISEQSDQDNLSTISDDDLDTSTNNQHEAYQDVSSPIFQQEFENFDKGSTISSNDAENLNVDDLESPESPDMDAVTGSPLKLIPVSDDALDNQHASENEILSSEEADSSENDEDIDDDILYLRLIALKSLAADADPQLKNDEDNEMALEMEQLLQEAQDAAEEAEVNENIEQDPNITINDQTNAQGCEGADVKGNSASIELSTTEDDPDAITLIEVVNKENKNVTTTIIDLVSPPPSPVNTCKETEPKESIVIEDTPNSPENIPLPSLPPLPEVNLSTPPPPLPPGTPPPPPLPASTPPKLESSNSKPDQASSLVPPSPANIQTVVTGASIPDNNFSQMPASFSSPPSNQNWFGATSSSCIAGIQNLQDSGSYHNSGAYGDYSNQTQEVIFGRPFPGSSNSNYSLPKPGASSWQTQCTYPGSYPYGSGFGNSQISQHLESSEYSDVAHFLSTVQSLTYQDWKPPEVPQHSESSQDKSFPVNESYDDFAPQVIYSNNKTVTPRSPTKRQKGRKQSKGQKRRKLASNSFTDDEEESLRAMLLNQLSNKSQEKDALKIDPRKHEKSFVKPVKTQVVKEIENVKPLEEKSKKVVQKLAQKEILPSKLKQPMKATAVLQKRNNGNAAIKKMSNSVLFRHFPNLSKKTVIPLNEPDSDDESDDDVNLVTNVQADKPKEELFESHIVSFLKGMRQLKENKTSLANSTPEKQKRLSMQLKVMYNKKEKEKTDISNLPLSKQIEYIQLKQLIARKESKLKKQAIVAKANETQLNKVKLKTTSIAGPVKVTQPRVIIPVKSIPKQVSMTKSRSVNVPQVKTTDKPVKKFKIIKKDSTKKIFNLEVKTDQVKEPEVMIVEENKTDSNDANDEEDEDILREMLLKEMQKKSKLTVNLSGDERMVRVKKYNLTPHFRKKPQVGNDSKIKTGEKSHKEEKESVPENDASKTKDTKLTTATEGKSNKVVIDESKLTTSTNTDKTVHSPRSAFLSRSAPSSPGKSRSPDGKKTDKSRTLSPSPLSRSSPNSPSRNSDSPSQAKKKINVQTNNPSTESTKEPRKVFPIVPKNLSTTFSEKSKDSSKKQDSKSHNVVVNNKILVSKQISVKKATNLKQNKIEIEKEGNIEPKKAVSKIPDPRIKKLKQPVNAGPATIPVSGPKLTATGNNELTKSTPVVPKANLNTKKTEELKTLTTASSEMIAELKKEENNVIEKRSGLTTALFRMSAQISQLEKWGTDQESARKLREKLVKELEEVDRIIKQRESGIQTTKIEIKNSHIKVNQLREEMENSEVRCEALGGQVYGPGAYKLSDKGAAEYRKKLDQIKNSAHKFSSMAVAASSTASHPVDSGHQIPGSNTNNISGNDKKPPSSGQSSVIPTANASDGGNVSTVLSLPSAANEKKKEAISSKDDYISPLNHVRSNSSPGLLLDPDKILCRFEIAGKCLDSSCPFQHCNSGR